jgi:putative ABC transport system substrate-binding protein
MGHADCSRTSDGRQQRPSRRRTAIGALLAMAVSPRVGVAQSMGGSYRIGFLGMSSAADYAPLLNAFLHGLRDLGYEDGRNIVIDYRWADGREERLPDLARQLVRLNPDVLVSHAIGVSAAQQATSTIPIVMGVSADPVGFGLVKSLAKPGGNTTGVASLLIEVASKRLELFKQAVPALKSVAVLSNLALPATRAGLEEMETAARQLGVRLRSYGVVADPTTLEPLFASIVRERPDGLLVQPDPITGRHGSSIAAFAVRHRLPTMGGGRQFVLDGALMSYGVNFFEGWRLAARYVDRILKGARPADLPVEQPTTFELVVNQKTAKSLALTIPAALLLRANVVVE